MYGSFSDGEQPAARIKDLAAIKALNGAIPIVCNRSCVAAKTWLGAKRKISLERAALRFKYESCFESFGMLY